MIPDVVSENQGYGKINTTQVPTITGNKINIRCIPSPIKQFLGPMYFLNFSLIFNQFPDFLTYF